MNTCDCIFNCQTCGECFKQKVDVTYCFLIDFLIDIYIRKIVESFKTVTKTNLRKMVRFACSITFEHFNVFIFLCMIKFYCLTARFSQYSQNVNFENTLHSIQTSSLHELSLVLNLLGTSVFLGEIIDFLRPVYIKAIRDGLFLP